LVAEQKSEELGSPLVGLALFSSILSIRERVGSALDMLPSCSLVFMEYEMVLRHGKVDGVMVLLWSVQ